ncbi:MAG TPA: hypothetical protein VJ717_20965 [Gemmatimonadaceae bacterium]|nr:hypothetical protein [Gemmatimonadaceae bacterium]
MIDVPNEDREDQGALPRETRSVLRDIYAPPADPGYWEALEARILARVRRDGARVWWMHFPDWMRAGLAAAAAAIILVGLIWFQDRRSAQRMAEERLLQPLIDEVPVLVETMADEPKRARDATLRYVISR